MSRVFRKAWSFIIFSVLLFGGIGYLRYTGATMEGSPLLAVLEGETTPIHIAIVIPEQATDTYPEQENVGRLFEKQVNQSGGVNGHTIKIDFYYDGKDLVEEAQAAAKQVVEDDRALVVIGHRNSAPSVAVAPIYDEAGIVTINAAAAATEVTMGRDWAFRVINDTTNLGNYAALYAIHVLGHQTASIIHEDDNFGTSLADAFQSTFEKNGGTIVYKESLTRVVEVNEESLNIAKGIVSNITPANGEDPGLVFLAVSRNTSQEIVTARGELNRDFPMLGSYSTGDANYAKLFDDPAMLNGLSALSLVNYDIAGEKAQEFYNEYIEMYPELSPSWLGGTTYDALLVALKAIDATDATGNAGSLRTERENIRKYLASMNSPSRSVDGVTGQIYFDSRHNFSQPPTFGQFQQGNYVPSPIQLRPVQNRELVDTQADNIIVDGRKLIYKTNVVYTGIRMNEITDVDVDKAHVFTADFYIWFRYQGDIDVGAIDFLNSVTPITLGDPVSSSTDNGINYKLYRVRSQFHTTFNLQNYPFDRQQLAIEFRHRTLTREKLIYVNDTLGMDHITHGSDLLTRINSDGVFSSVTDWNPSNPMIFIDVHSDKASFGNPVLLGSQQSVENSTFNMQLDIDRNYPRFMLKNLLPLFCLVALAYVSLFLPGFKFESVISVMTGSVLSIVFFHVNLSNRLNVGYNVALDYVFYATYLLFILELITVVFAWHRHQNDEQKAYKRMIFARFLYPAYLLVGTAIFAWVYVLPFGAAL